MEKRLVVHTIQMGKWRFAAERNIPLLNTTVKNGVRAFSPTWDMVARVKAKELSHERYTQLYEVLMNTSIVDNAETWEKLLNMGEVALGCFCKAHDFCHRYLLKDIVEKLCTERGIVFEYAGEIEHGDDKIEL